MISSLPVFSGVRVTRYFVLCVCFVDHCLSLCPFSFGHCVVCLSTIYGFWLLPYRACDWRHFRSRHFRLHLTAPPQIWLELYPYTTDDIRLLWWTISAVKKVSNSLPPTYPCNYVLKTVKILIKPLTCGCMHHRVMMKNPIIFWKPIIRFFLEPLYCYVFYVK
jgi:hypothetical protein